MFTCWTDELKHQRKPHKKIFLNGSRGTWEFTWTLVTFPALMNFPISGCFVGACDEPRSAQSAENCYNSTHGGEDPFWCVVMMLCLIHTIRLAVEAILVLIGFLPNQVQAAWQGGAGQSKSTDFASHLSNAPCNNGQLDKNAIPKWLQEDEW